MLILKLQYIRQYNKFYKYFLKVLSYRKYSLNLKYKKKKFNVKKY